MTNFFPGALLLMTTTAAEVDPLLAMLPQAGMMVVLVVVFYFMLIRPQKKREKSEVEMRNSLEVGDEITTRGGIIGRVSNIKDDVITIETGAAKVRINIERWSIASKQTKISE